MGLLPRAGHRDCLWLIPQSKAKRERERACGSYPRATQREKKRERESEGAPMPASYETQREGWAGRRLEGRMDDPYALQKERRERERVAQVIRPACPSGVGRSRRPLEFAEGTLCGLGGWTCRGRGGGLRPHAATCQAHKCPKIREGPS